MIDLSVVIPVYDEEESLPLLWSELRSVLDRAGLDFEVVFVDDGSRDRGAEVIRGLRDSDPRVRLVRLKANAGETAATDAGFHAARGRLIVTMDADLQNDPHDIPGLLRHLDQWDAVTGWRVDRGDGDSVVRRLSSRIANGVRNWLSDDVIQDSGCTFRAFRRECLRGLVLYCGFHRFSRRSSRCADTACSKCRCATGRGALGSRSTACSIGSSLPPPTCLRCAG